MDDLKTGKVAYPFVGAVDITTAFLSSPMPEGRKIFLRPPPAFVRAGLIPEDAMYVVDRGVYGLREAPKWWADKRTKDLKTVQNGKPQAVPWSSTKQKGIVAKNSSEAELIASAANHAEDHAHARGRGLPSRLQWLRPSAQVQQWLSTMEERFHFSSPQGKGASSQISAAPKPKQEVIAVLDVDSEDSSGLWRTSEEKAITGLLDFLKAVAIDWSSEVWVMETSSKQELTHWFREVVHLQLCELDVLIRINVLEFSYNPHNRDELLRVANWIQEAHSLEWLIEGAPKTPQGSAEKNVPSDPGMAESDVPMVPEDPYFDEDEGEINKLEQILKEKRDALAAKRRKIDGATRGI
eukprot:4773285-Amphidinium_carterae.1